MKVLELAIFLFEMPFSPPGGDTDFIEVSVLFEMVDPNLGDGDLV